MSIKSNKLAVAALAGLLSMGVISVDVAHAGEHDKTSAEKPAKEKHGCKGHNSCKGQGADGKNACKGQGSCKTDGE